MNDILHKTISTIPAEIPTTCDKEWTLDQVIKKLKENNAAPIIVVEDLNPVGIITERDILNRVVGNTLELKKSLVKDYMTESPVCLKQSDPILKAYLKMRMGNFRHIVVLDDEKHLSSVLSARDLLDYVFDSLEKVSN